MAASVISPSVLQSTRISGHTPLPDTFNQIRLVFINLAILVSAQRLVAENSPLLYFSITLNLVYPRASCPIVTLTFAIVSDSYIPTY